MIGSGDFGAAVRAALGLQLHVRHTHYNSWLYGMQAAAGVEVFVVRVD
jgi:hypothetical protein